MLNFFDILILLFSLGISFAIIVPCTGILVRFRANYNPKGLQLDAEGGASPHTGPVVKSYFSMMARVYRLEGWSGLYKGLMPTLLSTILVTVCILLFMDTNRPRHGAYKSPDTGVLGTLLYAVAMMLLSLPTAIVTYRSITTPHKLSYFGLMHSLRILLTPTERRKPWILYMTPGLLAAEVLHIAVVVLFLGPIRTLLLPALSQPVVSISDVLGPKAAVYVAIVALCTGVLAPLEVIATRLAIQRNHASAEFNSISQEVDGDAEDTEFSGTDEDVIGLRHEGDPYIGLVDCAKRIIDEEGISTLYRAWWITLLGGASSIFA